MARGKTKIALIADEKVLKSTFQKRKKGLIKKIKELTTLCDIIACIVIYGPVIGDRPPEIFTWPEEQDRVHAAIRMYKDKMDHSRRTADLCNFFKDRRLDLGMYKVDMAVSDGGFNEKPGMSAEVAMAYLKWVEARIKAVEERIDLVKNSSSMMFGNEQCQKGPVDQVDWVGNLGYGFKQEWSYMQNPYGDFGQVEVYDQALYRPMYLNLVPETLQFQQPFEQNAITGYQQDQNQMCLYDPYLMGMELSNTMAASIDSGQHYKQQQQHGENMHCLSNITQSHAEQPLMSSKMNDMMQVCSYEDDWSSPDPGLSNYSLSSSNQFNTAALDDPLEYFFNTAEFANDMQPVGDASSKVFSTSLI